MFTTFRLVWLAAVRDRVLQNLGRLAALAALCSLALSQATFLDIQAAAVTFAANVVRLLIVIGLPAFVAGHVQRLIESHEIEAALARPIGRGRVVLASALAYGALASLFALVATLALALLRPPSPTGTVMWGASLMLEATAMACLALTIALAMSGAMAAFLATLTIYVLGRLTGFFLDLVGGEFHLAADDGRFGYLARAVMEWLAVLVPRLDLLCQSNWLVDGPGSGTGDPWFIAQAAVYVPLLLLLAAIDLREREF